MPEISLETYQTLVGTRVGTSRWFEITQRQIDQFADITEDWQFIHLDPERAAQTPFGGTVAHGFLTLSMLSAMFYDAVPDFEKTTMGVNYGFDKLRFLSPVLAGARIRAHFDLTELTQVLPAEITTKWDTTIEIQGQTRPALSALWICRTYLEKT